MAALSARQGRELSGEVPDRAARSFERAAEDYERGRPEYPTVAIDVLASALGIGDGSTVVDLAVRTSKLTRALVPTGARVMAVEPVPGMRAQLVLLARTPSISFIATLPGSERSKVLDGVRAVVAEHPEAWSQGKRAMPYVTQVAWCHATDA